MYTFKEQLTKNRTFYSLSWTNCIYIYLSTIHYKYFKQYSEEVFVGGERGWGEGCYLGGGGG